MLRRTTLLIILTLCAVFSSYAEIRFGIRYSNKKIYYPGDKIELKLSVYNPNKENGEDETFFFADDPLQSFGFNVRSLEGEPRASSENFADSLNNSSAYYRVVNLAPGQEISIIAELNDWIDLSEPGQYRLTGYFFPDLRKNNSRVIESDVTLDLTILPETDNKYSDKLNKEIRDALIERDLSPVNVVREVLDNRKISRFNRAVIYFDLDDFSRTVFKGEKTENIEKMLLSGTWDNIPGFREPVDSYQIISYEVFNSEAIVRIKAVYNPHGEKFEKDLRFYLHNTKGYWNIRRIEAISSADADPEKYGMIDLSPPEVVTETIKAVNRGDWDIVLRYFDITDLVKNLPEYVSKWNSMSAVEHKRAVDIYKEQLISGRMGNDRKPLKDLENWKITRVNYTDSEASIFVENTGTYQSEGGQVIEKTLYTFKLIKTQPPESLWKIIKYETVILGRE